MHFNATLLGKSHSCKLTIYVLKGTQHYLDRATVLSDKSDSDVMFCLQVIRDLESKDHLCINPIRRIGSIHK